MQAFIPEEEVRERIRKVARGGRFFSVTFVKRTTGEVRRMNGRLGVRKGVTGEGLKFNPEEKHLIVMRDVHKQQFRMISADSVLAIQGKEAKV